MKIINLFLIAICITICTAEDQGDWVDPWKLPVEFSIHPFFAGYLDINFSRKYYYVYHPSEKNPSKDPLVVRVSAGPACSSLYSWLYTKGPFVFNPYTHDFRINPNNWNKEANVLFIEGPAGVGFSFDSSGTSKNISDELFAQEMVQSLYSFYAKFPELKDQDLYLTGEQYAGVTIPMIAKNIV